MKEEGIKLSTLDKLVHRTKEYGALIIIIGGIVIAGSIAYDTIFSNEDNIANETINRKSADKSIRVDFKDELILRDNRSDNRYDRAMKTAIELEAEIEKIHEKRDQDIKEFYEKWAESKAENAYLRGRLDQMNKK